MIIAVIIAIVNRGKHTEFDNFLYDFYAHKCSGLQLAASTNGTEDIDSGKTPRNYSKEAKLLLELIDVNTVT